MANDSGFFRADTVSKEKRGGLLPALKHNKRELPERGHIDTTRTKLNYSLTPQNDAKTLFNDYRKRLIDLDIKERKNGVQAIEAIFSLPVSWHSRNNTEFFVACFEWVQKTIQGEMLSFDVHLDEEAPHAHALVLPIVDGKLQGSNVLGGKGNIYRLQRAFSNGVGEKFGLPLNKRLNPNKRKELSKVVLSTMHRDNDNAIKSKLWTLFQDTIKRNPQPYADLLGVVVTDTKQKRGKSFVEIMTSKGKGNTKREEEPP